MMQVMLGMLPMLVKERNEGERGKGSQQRKGGKDLSEEREKIPGREKALGGKGGKDLNRERGKGS